MFCVSGRFKLSVPNLRRVARTAMAMIGIAWLAIGTALSENRSARAQELPRERNAAAECEPQSRLPNIVLIYADDIGYGDLGCYGATEVSTPHIDRLAREGLRFTDGHCSAATCTPSRYSLLTGEYAFRKPGTGVLPGDAALIIEPDRTTLASLLKRAGYATGVVGKWHLGLGTERGKQDWNGEIRPGPLEIGFDESFIMPATGDRVPCVYVRGHRVVGLDPHDPIEVSYQKAFPGEPTGVSHRSSLRLDWNQGHNQAVVNGVGRIGYMRGGKAALWNDESMADDFVREATTFIETHREQPFFLYFASHDIHVPRLPHPRFVGKTGMGPRGDAMVSFDSSVGAILETLDRLKLADNTLVLLTSDNGPVLDDGYNDEAATRIGKHRPAGPLRGGKYSAYEGGTRVPWIVRWPARVRAESPPRVSHALICQVDLFASLAKLVGQTIDDRDAPDSFDLLAALCGESPAGREWLVEQGGAQRGLRVGTWKYVTPPNRPANAKKGKASSEDVRPVSQGELFDLNSDLGESVDLAQKFPERSQAMRNRLEEIAKQGRSRP